MLVSLQLFTHQSLWGIALPLQIWDTGGQERFRSVVSTFYKGSDGCILAFDVTDPESFEALGIWRDDVLAKIIPMEQSYPMVVLGNKIDLEDRKVLFIHLFIHSFIKLYVTNAYQILC